MSAVNIGAIVRESQEEMRVARQETDLTTGGFMAEKLGITESEAESIIGALALGGLLLAPGDPRLAFEAVVVTASVVAAKILEHTKELA